MKIEYGDLYKFISSVGIMIIISPFVIAWFFLKEPFSWMLARMELSSLSENAQNFTIIREELLLFIISNIRIYFILSILVGIFMILVGIFLWVKRQRELDRNQTLINNKLEQELKDMSPKEIAENQVNSIEESYEKEVSNKIDNADNLKIKSEPNFFYKSNISEYVLIEDRVYNLFYELYNSKYAILKNKKIAKFEYDLILQNREPSKSDIIVEIKYMKSSFSRSRLIELKEKMEAYKSIYFNTLGKDVTAIIIIVVAEGQISRSTMYHYMSMVNSQEDNNQVLILYDTELKDINSEKLAKRIKI